MAVQVPLKITYTDFEPSPAVTGLVEKKANKLGRYYDRIVSCEVFIAAPHKRQKSKSYQININCFLPGGTIIVNRGAEKHPAHQNIRVAIRDAFNALYRQVEDFARKQRRDVKQKPTSPFARVERLFLQEGYGFIKTIDGRELYFHKNSVLDHKFADLKIGSEVTFAEENGQKGPQVTSMTVVKSA